MSVYACFTLVWAGMHTQVYINMWKFEVGVGITLGRSPILFTEAGSLDQAQGYAWARKMA